MGQGMSWLTNEQLVWNDKRHLSPHTPSTHKIPATSDVPEHLKIDLWPEPNREDNVFGSKAVGEPPLMLAISVLGQSRMQLLRRRATRKRCSSQRRQPQKTCSGR